MFNRCNPCNETLKSFSLIFNVALKDKINELKFTAVIIISLDLFVSRFLFSKFHFYGSSPCFFNSAISTIFQTKQIACYPK